MKILFVCGIFNPFITTSGANIRSYFICNVLCSIGDVDIITFNPNLIKNKENVTFKINKILFFKIGNFPFWGIPDKILKNTILTKLFRLSQILFKRNPFYYTNPKLSDKLSDHLKKEKYDIIFVQRLETALLLGLKQGNNIVIDIDDHPIDSISAKYLSHNVILKKLSQLKIKILYDRYKRNYKALFLSNKNQIKSLNEIFLPNLSFDPTFSRELFTYKNDPILLFIGSLGYLPNQKGLIWFVKYVWDNILNEFPECKLKIVGSGIPEDILIKMQNKKGIDYVGYVDNLDEIYNKTSVVISPIFSGGGTNIKILEAIKRGVPIVATSFSIRGYDFLNDNMELLLADKPNDFANKILKLLKDPDYAYNMANFAKESLDTSNFNFNYFSYVIKSYLK